jgi:hypothetical protein
METPSITEKLTFNTLVERKLAVSTVVAKATPCKEQFQQNSWKGQGRKIHFGNMQ